MVEFFNECNSRIFNYFSTLYSIYAESDLSFKIIFWILMSLGFAWLLLEFFGDLFIHLFRYFKSKKIGGE